MALAGQESLVLDSLCSLPYSQNCNISVQPQGFQRHLSLSQVFTPAPRQHPPLTHSPSQVPGTLRHVLHLSVVFHTPKTIPTLVLHQKLPINSITELCVGGGEADKRN